MYLPPPTEKLNRLAKVLGISIAIASAALIIYQQSRHRRTATDGVAKNLQAQFH
jgi:hypothetical protein